MRIFLISLCTLFASAALSQGNQLIGKWKMVRIYDERMYYDVKTDSLQVFKKDENLSKHQQDSVDVKVKMMFKDIFRDAYYQFNADSTYIENSGMNGERGGKYVVDKSTKTITLRRVRKSKATGEESIREEKIFYVIDGNLLRFSPPEEEKGPTIEFEK